MSRATADGATFLGGWAGWAAASIYARAVAFARRRALAGPRLHTKHPLVSIGNLTVGGTGKTPCTAWLANRLLDEGHAVAIVARPVGGKVPGGEGDEIALVRELAPRARVVAGKDKSEAARRADQALAPGGVILADDAFSHWKLERDLDLVLVDAPRPLGNGHMLPLGRLRESPQELARAGVVVLTRADRIPADELARTRAAIRSLAPGSLVAAARHVPGPVRAGGAGEEVSVPPGQPAVCLSAIARSDELARAASSLRMSVEDDIDYPDHHRFTAREWRDALARAERRGAWLVTTRKDAVRLAPAERARVHVIDVRFEFMDGEDEVMERIRRVLR